MASEWRRLSVFAIVFFTFKTLRQLLNLYPAIIGAAFTARQFELSAQDITFYLLSAAVVVIISATLSWFNFRYVYEQGAIRVRSGVLSKEQIELRYDRIQSVSIKQPFYYRPFDLVILSIDSAGSSQSEVNIAGLKSAEAIRLKAEIQSYSAEASADGSSSVDTAVRFDQAGAEKSAENEELLLERRLRDLIIYGLTRNRAWIILAFIWPFFNRIESGMYRVSDTLGFDLSAWIDAQSALNLVALAALLAIVFVLLTSGLSVASSIFALANYRLSYRCGSYQRNSGLLNRYEIKVKRSRIQSIVYEKSWLDSIFQRSVMMMEPFSSGAGQHSLDGFMQKVVVPSVSDTEFARLAAHVYPNFALNLRGFSAISRFFILRQFVKYAVLFIVAIVSLVLFTKDLVNMSAIFLLPVILPVIILRWRRYGWQLVGDYFVLRTGFIGTTLVCFPRYKIQQAQFHQSLMLKRRGLATVTLVLASRTVTLPLIKEVDAYKILNRAVADAEFSGRSWM